MQQEAHLHGSGKGGGQVRVVHAGPAVRGREQGHALRALDDIVECLVQLERHGRIQCAVAARETCPAQERLMDTYHV